MVGRAVVNIRTEKAIDGGGHVFRHYRRGPEGVPDPLNPFFDGFGEDESRRKYTEQSLGSGFFFDTFGHIVTNYHVVKGAEKIKVRLQNGKEFDADVVGSDPFTDLALLRIDSRRISSVIPLGDSDQLKVGEWVAAVGCPFGLEHTITVGIVSATARVVGMGDFDNFIQTDAAINPGNSGGPLLNVKGEVVGVNTAIAAGGSGIGFAIPINMAAGVIRQLRERGEVSRGWLGIVVQDIDPAMADYLGLEKRAGVLVSQVYAENPAEEAGLEANDVLLEIDGVAVRKKADLPGIVSSLQVGSDVELKIFRNQRTMTTTMRVGRREDVDVEALKPSKGLAHKFGIIVIDIRAEEMDRFQLEDDSGVLVADVDPRGQGGGAGIFVGDVIQEINHQSVSSVADYKEMIRRVGKGGKIKFLIRRKGLGYTAVQLYK